MQFAESVGASTDAENLEFDPPQPNEERLPVSDTEGGHDLCAHPCPGQPD